MAFTLSANTAYWKSMHQELKEVNAWNVNVWSIMVNVH